MLYVYDRKKKPFPLKESVSVSEWSVKSETVKLSHPRALAINKKKRELQNDLLEVADFLINSGLEPHPATVAQEYENLLLRRKQDEARKKQGFLMAKGLRIVAEEDLKSADIALQELELQKQGILARKKDIYRDATEYGYEVSGTFTEEAILFKALLKEYVEEKAGCWFDAPKEVKSIHNDATKKGLRSWAKNFVAWSESAHFQQLGILLTFSQLDRAVYKNYGDYMMSPTEKHKMFDNAFGGQVRKCKTFFHWVADEKGIQVDTRFIKHWKVLAEEKLIVTLSPKEIDLVWNHDIAPKDEKYRDLLVFGCLTSLRISDIKNTEGVILDDNGFLRGRTKKNKGNYKIDTTLDKRIVEIGEKYNWNLDVCTEQAFNREIKKILAELFKKQNINQRKIQVPKYRWGKLVEHKKSLEYKHNMFTSHCCRRSWVTNMSARGLSDSVLMEMMGSASEKEFKKYKAVKVKHIREEVTRTSTNI